MSRQRNRLVGFQVTIDGARRVQPPPPSVAAPFATVMNATTWQTGAAKQSAPPTALAACKLNNAAGDDAKVTAEADAKATRCHQ